MRTRNNTLLNLCMMTLLLLSRPGLASDDLIDQWYLQPNLQLEHIDLGQQTLSSQRIFLGQRLNKRINLEINLLSDQPDYKIRQQGIVIDGRYYLSEESRFNPYIAGGISQLKDRQFNHLYDPTANIGIGFEHTMRSNGARIHADLRYFMDEDRNSALSTHPAESNDWSLRLGVSVPLSFDLFK